MSVLGIGGNLNFNALSGAGGALSGLGSAYPGANLGGLASGYNSAYQAALGMNQQLYQNILQGYSGLAAGQKGAQVPIQAGYQGLQGQVAQILGQNYGTPGVNNQWGVAAPAALAIQQNLTAQTGQRFDTNGNPIASPLGGSVAADLQNRGLANTSIGQSAQNAANLQYGQSIGSLGAQLGQTYAGYASNLGLAGLGYANQANLQNTQLGQNELNWMNTIQAPYPNAALYGQLAQGAGAYQAAMQARGLNNPYGGFGTAGVARSGGNMSTMGGMDTSGYGAPGGIQPYGLNAGAYAGVSQQPSTVQPTSNNFAGSGAYGMPYSGPLTGGNAVALPTGFGGGTGNIINSPTGYSINAPTNQGVYGQGLIDAYQSQYGAMPVFG